MRRRGFTLIELLIAVAITALVMVMVSGILLSTLDASTKVADKLATEKAGYGCLSLLRRDLEAVYAYALAAPGLKGERATELGQPADRLTLVVADDGPKDDKGRVTRFQRVSYRLAQAGESLGLYRSKVPWKEGEDASGQQAPPELGLVQAGIRSLKLSYWEPKEKKWVEGDWTSASPPRLVKVELELARDRALEDAARQDGVDLPSLKFEMSIGISARTEAPPPPPTGTKPP